VQLRQKTNRGIWWQRRRFVAKDPWRDPRRGWQPAEQGGRRTGVVGGGGGENCCSWIFGSTSHECERNGGTKNRNKTRQGAGRGARGGERVTRVWNTIPYPEYRIYIPHIYIVYILCTWVHSL
jgi:hypothetical protein